MDKKPHLTRRLVKHAHHVIRALVRVLVVLLILLLTIFVLLRTKGIPDIVLHKILKRVNTAGVPVTVDKVRLTFGGWRADNVRYYSKDPDSLDPLIAAETVLLRLRHTFWDAGPDGWRVGVEADKLKVSPIYNWGLEIPRDHSMRIVDKATVNLVFLPDRMEVIDGRMEWLQTRLTINGTLLWRERKPKPAADDAPGVQKERTHGRKMLLSREQFQTLEDEFKDLVLPSGVDAGINFLVDLESPEKSLLNVALQADHPEYKNVHFSNLDLVVSAVYPEVRIKHASLSKNGNSLDLAFFYNMASNTVQGTLSNTIVSREVIDLLPEKLFQKMGELGFTVGEIPNLTMTFGPKPIKGVLDALSGSFSFHNLSYKDVDVLQMEGEFVRAGNRLDLKNLKGTMRGQEARAAEMKTSMRGGPVSGSVFWDGDSLEFGVKVDSSCDPNLIYTVLSPVRIATNIMHRFRFNGAPPQLHIELGSPVNNWKEFYIDIAGTATDLSFQGVECSSADLTTFYKHGVFRLEPATIVKGGGSTSGTAAIDFKQKTATFDVVSTMNPAVVEKLIYEPLAIFETHLKVIGDEVDVVAKGTFDWGTMEQTDFTAGVRAKRFKCPIGYADDLTADVSGKGPEIKVSNARFALCGGSAIADFSVRMEPGEQKKPYRFNLTMNEVNLQDYILDLNPASLSKTTGKIKGAAHIQADLSTNFFAAASGMVHVRIDDGQLADLPLFKGFSRLIRMVFAGFDAFSITTLSGTFMIADGKVTSEDVYFGGNFIGAEGKGLYDVKTGYDAYIQAQVLNKTVVAKLLRFVTYPLTKFLEIRLEGTWNDPSWSMKSFPKEVSNFFSTKKRKEAKEEKKEKDATK